MNYVNEMIERYPQLAVCREDVEKVIFLRLILPVPHETAIKPQKPFLINVRKSLVSDSAYLLIF